MDWIKMACIALVVCVIGPLFWLGVNTFETWVWRSVGRWRVRRHQAKQAAPTNR
jgi:hypothetical protein